jgi:hypothetical protein
MRCRRESLEREFTQRRLYTSTLLNWSEKFGIHASENDIKAVVTNIETLINKMILYGINDKEQIRFMNSLALNEVILAENESIAQDAAVVPDDGHSDNDHDVEVEEYSHSDPEVDDHNDVAD